jgi:hypothetical protein
MGRVRGSVGRRRGGSYNDGVFVPLLLLAVAFTTIAGMNIGRAWGQARGAAAAGLSAVPAVAVVLVLAVAIGLRG